MKLIYIIGFHVLLLTTIKVYGQTDFDKWYQEHQVKFNQFVSEEDKKFVAFLKEEWKRYNLMEGIKRDTVPKPPVIPVYKPDVKEEPIIEEVPEDTLSQTPKLPVKIEEPKLEEEIPKVKPFERDEPSADIDVPNIDYSKLPFKTNINFFGEQKNLRYTKNFDFYLNDEISNESIAQFWISLSSINYNGILQQFEYYKEEMTLNDWGYIQLVNELTKILYPNHRNERHLVAWFFLLKSGYQVKVGFINQEIYLFFPALQNIFDWAYLKSNSYHPRLYILDLDNMDRQKSGSLYTYDEDYPGADKILDMSISKFPKINSNYSNRLFRWELRHQQYEIDIKYNLGFIEYTKDYPYSDFSIYFNSEVSPIFKSDIITKFKKLVKDKSEKEAADLLLAFVQKSFGYKTDGPQFGREKPLFPEETIYYPYSDCEDRSVLFSFLVRNVLGLKLIGINYPGHIATAVKFNEDVEGKKITYNGDQYTICDPTYIGASVGMEMPGYGNKTKDFIKIN